MRLLMRMKYRFMNLVAYRTTSKSALFVSYRLAMKRTFSLGTRMSRGSWARILGQSRQFSSGKALT